MITLGTGVGSTLSVDGRIVGLNLAFHPFIGGPSYTEQLSERTREDVGTERWLARCTAAVDVLLRTFSPDQLFLEGGNARHLADADLGSDVTIVANEVALKGAARVARTAEMWGGWSSPGAH